jgi:hypothetical protein
MFEPIVNDQLAHVRTIAESTLGALVIGLIQYHLFVLALTDTRHRPTMAKIVKVCVLKHELLKVLG